MTEKNDGGNFHQRNSSDMTAGISRRDWLAGLAMQALVANEEARQQSIKTAEKFKKTAPEITAFIAYELADFMITESNK